MKKYLIILLLLIASPCHAFGPAIQAGVSAGGAAVACAISDNFNRTENPVTGWYEVTAAGDWSTDGSVLSGESAGSVYWFVRNTTATSSVTQYARVKLVAIKGVPGICFRGAAVTGNDASSYCVIRHSDGNTYGGYFTSDGYAESMGTAGTGYTWTDGDTMCATVTGTQHTTQLRVWKNCTGIPTAADNWGGSEALLFEDDNATHMDTGLYVGLVGKGSSGSTTFDEFCAGGL